MQELESNYIGQKIKFFRKQNGLTQSELAEKIGISEKHISKIELGIYIPTLFNFIKILEILNLDFKDFGIYTKNKKPTPYQKILELLNKSTNKELEYCAAVIQSTNKYLN